MVLSLRMATSTWATSRSMTMLDSEIVDYYFLRKVIKFDSTRLFCRVFVLVLHVWILLQCNWPIVSLLFKHLQHSTVFVKYSQLTRQRCVS